MVYIKIILASLVWGVLFYYGGSSWLDKKREQTCTLEIKKSKPNLDVVKERCLQTAEVYMKKEDYSSASWFYVLGGELDKNLNEVDAKITKNFHVNIAHTYLLKGDYEKAQELYRKFPWEGGINFHYVDDGIQPDFAILPKIYKDKKENIAKGLAMWNEVYEPIGKIVKASNGYSIALDEENTTQQIYYLEKYLEYAKPFKDEVSIDYLAYKQRLLKLLKTNNH